MVRPTYTRIGRPLEGVNASTPTEYLAIAQSQIDTMRQRRPALVWPDLHLVETGPHDPPQVRQGRWLVGCACGNWPHYDPDWQMAVCLECAAVYTKVAPPDRWQDAETVLMRRPDYQTRNWLPHESVEALVQENAQHGVEASDGVV